MTKKITKMSFEEALKELESIVGTMEQGGIGLDESLALFTRGTVLVRESQQTLKDAEQKIKVLTGKDLTEFELNNENQE